jgi:hypothetical protein
MAQSMSKNMMYIAPFFALTGLYWQYGLVIYWVTTNIWTLGQQHILFRNLPIVGSATVGASAVGAASGSNRPVVKSTAVKGSVNAVKSNGTARAASKPGTASKPATNGAKPGAAGAATAKVPTAKASPAKSAANGTGTDGTAANGAAANGAGTKRAVNNGTVSSSEAGSGGRGLLGFGKKKPEPEEVPVVPETKVVRQQPVRQARSKRSGNAGNAGKR